MGEGGEGRLGQGRTGAGGSEALTAKPCQARESHWKRTITTTRIIREPLDCNHNAIHRRCMHYPTTRYCPPFFSVGETQAAPPLSTPYPVPTSFHESEVT